MGSYKLKRLELPQNVIEFLERQNLSTCKDALLLTVTELQSLLGISYDQAVKIQNIISKKCVSEPHTAYDVYINQSKHFNAFFPSSLCNLDMLLHGGLHLGSVTEITGPPGVGKTQFCFMLSILTTLPTEMGGLNGQVMYIDTESAFSAERLKEMARARYPKVFQSASDLKHLLERIFVHKAVSIHALKKIIPNTEQEIIKKKIKLVIIDSVASLFRKEYGSSILQSITERNNILLEQASILKDIAHTYGIVVFLTNQITSHSVDCDPNLAEYFLREKDDNESYEAETLKDTHATSVKKLKLSDGINVDCIIPALGTTWAHCVNTRLVARFVDSCIRQLIIAKSPVAPTASMKFILNETGIVLTDDDIELMTVFNAEHQNISSKNCFLNDEITGTGTIFSLNTQHQKIAIRTG